MKMAVVHGKKLLNNGELNPEFMLRLNKAVELFKKRSVEQIVVSGGQTRAQFPSEAQLGLRYLVNSGIPENKIKKLTNVYTTIDEVRSLFNFVDNMGGIDKIYAIMSSWPMFRTRLIFFKLWNSDIKINFVSTKTSEYLYYLLTEPFAILFALLYSPNTDVTERLMSWFKIEFRNAGIT